MKIYLSARFDRRAEIAGVRQKIEAHFNHMTGHKSSYVEVVARWLDNPPYPEDPAEQLLFLRDRAYMDFADVAACDVLARFSDDLINCDRFATGDGLTYTPVVPASWATGARMEETGYAQALGKTIVIVGGRQSVFDNLPNRVQLATVEDLYKWLGM